jgi:hypothetical protein|tara:strand:+ start:2868 stop:3461 length:594 start_codon:yes stop_codon:yes gene_type:complete
MKEVELIVKAERVKELREARESSTRFPWERQFNESRKAFEAFVVYRDMGTTRSQEKVGRELGKSAKLMGRWSAKWAWVDRVEGWVDEQDRELRLAQSEAVVKMNQRHAALAAALTGKIVEKLGSVSAEEIEKTSLVSLSRLLEVGVKVERQARGEAGEVVSDRIVVEKTLEHLTTEELEELERIHDVAAERAKQDQD